MGPSGLAAARVSSRTAWVWLCSRRIWLVLLLIISNMKQAPLLPLRDGAKLSRVHSCGCQVAAVRLFFTPEEDDDAQNRAKRHFLQTGDSRIDQELFFFLSICSFSLNVSFLASFYSDNAKESLALMPLSKPRERLMLRALNRYGVGPDGCAQAWLSLPHSTRVFYLHAYCSRSARKHHLVTLFNGSLTE